MSRSSHLRRTGAGSRGGSSAAILCAKISATEVFGREPSMDQALRRRASPKPGMRLTAMTTAKVMASMIRPRTVIAPRSPDSLRSKMSTEITLVSEVNSMMAADNSRITPTKMKHQVAITLVRNTGAVMSRQGAQGRRAEDAARVLEVRMHRAKSRLQLLVGGGQPGGDENDQQYPQRAVKHERRPRVAQEQAYPKHDAGNGDRRGREKAERAIAPDGAARGEIGNHQRQDGADGGRGHAKHEGVLDGKLSGRQFEEYEMDVVQREIVERQERGGDAGERGIEQRAIGKKHRTNKDEKDQGKRRPFERAEPDPSRVALLSADHRIAAPAEDKMLGAQQRDGEHEQGHRSRRRN